MDSEDDPILSSVEFDSPRYKGMTCHLALAMFACVIGSSFLFGYSTGVVNSPQQEIEKFLNETHLNRTGEPLSDPDVVWSWIVSIWCIGGMLGGLSGGFFIKRLGSKGMMIWNNLIMVIGTALMCFSKKAGYYEMLIAGRFVVGIACGIATVVAPTYLSEIAPIRLRGLAGTLNQLAIVLAILFSQVLGLHNILGTENGWPYLFGIPFLTGAVQLILIPFCPESPRHLLLTLGHREKAQKALTWLRGTSVVQDEVEEILQEQQDLSSQPETKVLDLFRDSSLRKPLLISVVMMLSQQFSGINAVIYYSTTIFMGAGLAKESAQYATLAIGGVLVVMTFVSAVIVDNAGRRTLHLTGLAGMWFFGIVLTLGFAFESKWHFMAYVSVIATLAYVIFFAVGPGSIPWFYVAEIFNQGPRAAAMSIAVLVNWFANFAVGKFYPIIQKAIPTYSFLPFVGLLTLFCIFVYFKVPETKGRKIEDITAEFRSDQQMAYSSLS